MLNLIEKNYLNAKEQYKKIGIDTDEVLKRLEKIRISLQCWQTDDINGLLFKNNDLSGGIQVTGNYPKKARNFEEITNDLSKALSLIPGKQRVNLHAIYADTKDKVDLNELEPIHFKTWVDWAKKEGVALDFNPTCFAHEMSKDGFTLSSSDEVVRKFYVEHVKRSRRIAKYFAQELNEKSVCNIWIPDGYKDYPYDRLAPRMRLKKSLDEIYSEKIDSKYILDAMEPKLFGIGSEAYTTGSHDFYLAYAAKNNKGICLDSGHFHPTESISDKISSALLFLDEICLHVSRPMRWDSDHIVSFDDELQRVSEAIIRNNLEEKVFIGLDYFDATVSRTAALVLGVRNTQKALLKALLEPTKLLMKKEEEKDFTSRLVYTEELKSYPLGHVYDYYCMTKGVPVGLDWLDEIKTYEENLNR